jgi:hypothetical protein
MVVLNALWQDGIQKVEALYRDSWLPHTAEGWVTLVASILGIFYMVKRSVEKLMASKLEVVRLEIKNTLSEHGVKLEGFKGSLDQLAGYKSKQGEDIADHTGRLRVLEDRAGINAGGSKLPRDTSTRRRRR